MKGIYFLIISVLYANITTAQNESCRLTGTKWAIKNIESKRTENVAEDSLLEKRFFDKYESTCLYFYTRKCVSASWGEYRLNGKYKIIKEKRGSQILDVSFNGLEFFEKGPLDKALFASFIYSFKSYPKYFLDDCSFVVLMKMKGMEYKIFYAQIK